MMHLSFALMAFGLGWIALSIGRVYAEEGSWGGAAVCFIQGALAIALSEALLWRWLGL